MPQFWPMKLKGSCAGWLLGKMLFLPVKEELYFSFLAVFLLHAFEHGCEDTTPRVATAFL